VALGLELEEVPIQKSALQEFQARLVLHEQGEALLKKSIDEADVPAMWRVGRIRVALDTTPTLGKGAVKGHLQPAGRRDRENWRAGWRSGR